MRLLQSASGLEGGQLRQADAPPHRRTRLTSKELGDVGGKLLVVGRELFVVVQQEALCSIWADLDRGARDEPSHQLGAPWNTDRVAVGDEHMDSDRGHPHELGEVGNPRRTNFGVNRLCRVPEVSRSGYYRHQSPKKPAPDARPARRRRSPRSAPPTQSTGAYVAPRVHAELRARGRKITAHA